MGAGTARRVLVGCCGGSRCEDGFWCSVVGCGLWVVGCVDPSEVSPGSMLQPEDVGLWAHADGGGLDSSALEEVGSDVGVSDDDGRTAVEVSDTVGGLALEGLATTTSAIIWDDGESWAPYASFRGSANLNHVRYSHLALATVRTSNSVGGCSGAMISRSRLVTATHCGATTTTFATFLSESPTRMAETEQRFRDLGFYLKYERAQAAT